MGDNIIVGRDPWGGRSCAVFDDHTGPTSYTAGGEKIGPGPYGGPNPLGLSAFYKVIAGLTDSGNYNVTPYFKAPGLQQNVYLKWAYANSASQGIPLTLGTLSAAATLSAMTTNGVVTVTGVNTLKAGNFVVLTNGATAVGIFMNGAIVQITSATPTSYTFNFAAAKSLNYASAADTLKYQIVYGGSTGNPVALGTATGQSIAVSAVAVASNVLTITCTNTGTSIQPGNFIVLQGLAAGEVPQGAIVQVLTANTTTLTANLIAPNLSATSGETGTATVLVTNGNAPILASQDTFAISGSTVAATAASSSAAGAITTLPVTQNLTPGSLVIVQGLTHGAALNGLITPVLAASLSPTNITTNGYIATGVTTGTGDTGILGLLSTGLPVGGTTEVPAGTNLSGETVRLLAIGG